jgi:NADPH2:quinone reductase
MEEKAIRFDKYGPPSVLSLVDIERPALRSGEVLVEIKASAINPSDVGNVAAAFQAELPRVPGRDFAGVVVEGGGDEWNGEEVWGSGAGLGVKKDGSHAQYVAIPLDWLSAKPANLSMGEASAVGVPYLVSWKALVDAADIQSGETVLITGVAGAVGQAATQIAHWMGATVIGADLGDKPSDADMSINTKDKDLDAEVKRLTNNKGRGSGARCCRRPDVRAGAQIAPPRRKAGGDHERRPPARRIRYDRFPITISSG